ncbi:MAG: RnfABCDGE type electron transport complex subunit D, partial [Phycisphaeraceae bacterium]|nr:RnfABCDGE type electron transport complex subunit D [Phycisphaeraceae bacterium]
AAARRQSMDRKLMSRPGATGMTVSYAPPWLGLLHTRRQIDIQMLIVVVAMAVSSLIFFGHVALIQILLCVVSAMSAYLPAMLLMWIFHRKPHADSIMHAVTMAMLVGLIMPVNSLAWQQVFAGAILGICMPFVGRTHRIRMHPAVLAVLITWALPLMLSNVHQPNFSTMFESEKHSTVLRPDCVIFGNVHDGNAQALRNYQPWWLTGKSSLLEADHGQLMSDAIVRPIAHNVFIRDQKRLLRFPRYLANMMASGELPRIEELILGCVPGMIGATSSGLLIILGLYLMYRRQSWWSIPVNIMLAAGLTLMAMPVMLSHGATTVFWVLIDTPPAFSLTYLGYFFLTSPMLLVAFILAPATSPLASHGRLLYCIIIGVLMVVIQWFVQIPVLTLLSVLFAGIVSRMLDNLHSRPGR